MLFFFSLFFIHLFLPSFFPSCLISVLSVPCNFIIFDLYIFFVSFGLSFWIDFLERLVIVEARYGHGGSTFDVKERIKARISGGTISLFIDNESMGGDPAPTFQKSVFVRYTYDGVENTKTVQEFNTLSLP